MELAMSAGWGVLMSNMLENDNRASKVVVFQSFPTFISRFERFIIFFNSFFFNTSIPECGPTAIREEYNFFIGRTSKQAFLKILLYGTDS